ncbi:MAG: tetratricopeptide repeat protein [Candidatus Obscuribacterales bacterium]
MLALSQAGVPAALASATKTAYEKFILASDAGRWDLALKVIDKLVRTGKPDCDYLCERARVYTELKHYKNAMDDLNAAIKLVPDNAIAHRRRAYLHLIQRHYREGISDLDLAIRQVGSDPVNVVPLTDYTNRARAYALLGARRKAAADEPLARACDALKQALDFREASNLKKAEEIANRIVKSNPNMIQAYMVRGLIRLNASKNKEALKDLDRVLTMAPDLCTFAYFRADACIEMGNYPKAIADYSKIIEKRPRLVLFDYTANTGRFRQHFEYRDENFVNLADIYFLRGSCYSRKAQLALAEKDFSSAIMLDAGEWECYFERGNVRLSQGKPKAAVADYTACLKLKRDFWDCLIKRSSAHEKLKENDLAVADLTSIIKANPADAGIYLLRAQLFERLKSHDRALADYTEMIRRAPSDDDGYKARGDLYFKLGRYKKAVADFDRAIKLGSEDKATLLKSRAAALKKMQ